MLLMIQCLDKLAAARVEFTHQSLLAGTCLSEALTGTNNWIDPNLDFSMSERAQGEDRIVDEQNCEDSESGPVEELGAIADVKLPVNRHKFFLW